MEKKEKIKHNSTNISLHIFGRATIIFASMLLSLFGILQLIDYLFPFYTLENPKVTIIIFMIIASISLALFWVFFRKHSIWSIPNHDVEYPKTDHNICIPEIPMQSIQLVNKIKEIYPNLDFKGIVACADLDHLIAYEVSKKLNKPFTTIHTSKEWRENFNLNSLRYDKLNPGDNVILVLWVASNGTIIKRVLPILKENKILVRSAFCMIEKKNDAREILTKNNIKLHYVINIEKDYGDV